MSSQAGYIRHWDDNTENRQIQFSKGPSAKKQSHSEIQEIPGTPSQSSTQGPPPLYEDNRQPVRPFQIAPDGTYPNGYRFPPKRSCGQATKQGLVTYWRFSTTCFGFLVVLWAISVLGWGVMLVLLSVGVFDSTMCSVQTPPGSGKYIKDCNSQDSQRRIWIEISAQVLTALFVIPAFGRIPWRLRDLYYEMKWRLSRSPEALRRLAGWHRRWIRLPGSQKLDPLVRVPQGYGVEQALPSPVERAPDIPLTGVRAPPTSLWKLDLAVWFALGNTIFMVCLCTLMWGENRYTRSYQAVGLFVLLAWASEWLSRIIQFFERRRIRKVEGVPLDYHQVRRFSFTLR